VFSAVREPRFRLLLLTVQQKGARPFNQLSRFEDERHGMIDGLQPCYFIRFSHGHLRISASTAKVIEFGE